MLLTVECKDEKKVILAMSWCAAVGCANKKKREKHLTFFKLPKEEEVAKQWLTKIKRENVPQNVFLCEQHFENDCFDASVDRINRHRLETGRVLYHSAA